MTIAYWHTSQNPVWNVIIKQWIVMQNVANEPLRVYFVVPQTH